MDEFAGAVSDVIKKGVVYYTNLPAGSGSHSGKQKARGGGQHPWLPAGMGVHGCSHKAEHNMGTTDIEVAPNQVITNNRMDDI
jgi:hypothetical protein